MNALAHKAGGAMVPGLLSSGISRSFAVRTAAWVDANTPSPTVAAAMHRAAWRNVRELHAALFNAEVKS